MPKTEIEYDEIPDSLFREIFRKNTVFLLCILIVVISCSSFLFYKVIEPSYKTISYFNLVEKSKEKFDLTLEREKVLQILKSGYIRSEIIQKYNLTDHYELNMNDENYHIKLDKCLYDNLKVESQFNGTILVSFIDKNPELSIDIIEFLVDYAQKKNGNELIKTVWDIEPSKESTYKVQPKFISLFLLILAPVFLIAVILIAVKEKIYLNSMNAI